MKSNNKEVLITCDCKSEIIKFEVDSDEGFEDTVYMMVYRFYDHQKSLKNRLIDIWKILRGKQIVGYDLVLSKKDLKEKINQL